ncbi:hypothetical protein [Microcystis phage Mwe-JY26]
MDAKEFAIAIGSAEPYLSTHSGRRFHFLNPRREDVSIHDIAHQTAMKCRFGGAVNHFYSVAQHSALCAIAARGNWATRMAALLHDANEAYLPDVQRPLKRAIASTWASIEVPAEDAIFRFLMGEETLKEVDWDEVKRVDNLLLVLEARVLLHDPHWAYDAHWGVDRDMTIRSIDPTFTPQPPLEARAFFLDVWCGLQEASDMPPSYEGHLLKVAGLI